jgi:hypothetical protein
VKEVRKCVGCDVKEVQSVIRVRCEEGQYMLTCNVCGRAIQRGARCGV